MVFFFYIILSIITVWSTYFLSIKKMWGPVKASSFIAVLIGTIYQVNAVFLDYDLPVDIPFVVIGSTFMGMISSRRHFRNFHFFIAPVFFILIYYNISKNFNGFGGALGTAACISLLITIFLRSFKTTKRIIKPFRRLKIETLRRQKLKRIQKNK